MTEDASTSGDDPRGSVSDVFWTGFIVWWFTGAVLGIPVDFLLGTTGHSTWFKVAEGIALVLAASSAISAGIHVRRHGLPWDSRTTAKVRSRPEIRQEGPRIGSLSSDGLQFWTGSEWISVYSPDGRMRWDGSHWAPEWEEAPPGEPSGEKRHGIPERQEASDEPSGGARGKQLDAHNQDQGEQRHSDGADRDPG